MATYMPDPDNLAVFARWEDAREYLRESLESWHDSLNWDVFDNEAIESAQESMNAAMDALANLLPNMPGEVFANDDLGNMWPHFISESMERPEDY